MYVDDLEKLIKLRASCVSILSTYANSNSTEKEKIEIQIADLDKKIERLTSKKKAG